MKLTSLTLCSCPGEPFSVSLSSYNDQQAVCCRMIWLLTLCYILSVRAQSMCFVLENGHIDRHGSDEKRYVAAIYNTQVIAHKHRRATIQTQTCHRRKELVHHQCKLFHLLLDGRLAKLPLDGRLAMVLLDSRFAGMWSRSNNAQLLDSS